MEQARERFAEKYVVSPNSCWIWIGTYDGRGLYGRFWFRGRKIEAHRFSLWLFNGKQPPRHLDGHHECGVENCVNPRHLRLVRPATNQFYRRRNYCSLHDERMVWVCGRMRCRSCHAAKMRAFRCRKRQSQRQSILSRAILQ